jgi:hypothetical protein
VLPLASEAEWAIVQSRQNSPCLLTGALGDEVPGRLIQNIHIGSVGQNLESPTSRPVCPTSSVFPTTHSAFPKCGKTSGIRFGFGSDIHWGINREPLSVSDYVRRAGPADAIWHIEGTIPGENIDPSFDLMYLFEVMDNAGNGMIYPDLAKETPYIVVKVEDENRQASRRPFGYSERTSVPKH